MNFILIILVGATLYCVYTLSLPVEDLTKLSIDFRRAYYRIQNESYFVINQKSLKTLKITRSITNKTYPAKTYIDKYGYRRFKDSHKLVSHWVVEKHIRKLNYGEVVHHIDGVKRNNRINNLKIFQSWNEHDMYHKNHLKSYGTWHEDVPKYANYKKYPEYAKQS